MSILSRLPRSRSLARQSSHKRRRSQAGTRRLNLERGFERLEERTVLSISVPVLNSNPGAPASLYLDFDGHFEATWGSYSNITTPVFNQDGDATSFSSAEIGTI